MLGHIIRLDELSEQAADVLEQGHHEERVEDVWGGGGCLRGHIVVGPALVLCHPRHHHWLWPQQLQRHPKPWQAATHLVEMKNVQKGVMR